MQGPFDVKVSEVSRGGPFRGGAEYQVEVTLEVHRENRPAFGDASHQDDRLRAPRRAGDGHCQRGLAAGDRARKSPVRHNRRWPVGLARVIVRAARPFRVLGVDGTSAGVSVELPPPPRHCPSSS